MEAGSATAARRRGARPDGAWNGLGALHAAAPRRIGGRSGPDAGRAKQDLVLVRSAARPSLVLALLAGVLLLLAPRAASALAMIDFASNSDQFSIASWVIDFGNDLDITSARDNADVADPSVLGFSVELDPVTLTGSYTQFFGIYFFAVDQTSTYQLRIRDLANQLVLQADYDPGEMIAVAASGSVSPAVAPDVTNVLNFFPGSYPSLDDLTGALSIDFNATLSAAGQDVGALIIAGTPVSGSAAGTLVVTAVPEPGTLALMATGLLGLFWQGGRRRG